MPSLAATRKGIYTGGLDGNSDKKEERCFFGLLSLRAGIITHATVYLLVLGAIGFTTTREELLTSESANILSTYVPIPFMNRGMSFLTIYMTFTPLIGLYGAYNRSYRAMKISKIVSYGEVLYTVNYLTWKVIVLLTIMSMSATSPSFVAFGQQPDMSAGDWYILYRMGYTFITTFVASVTAVEIRMLYVKIKYEKFLAPVEEEEEEEEENDYCGCSFVRYIIRIIYFISGKEFSSISR
ncbi:hypothetical protein EDC94DRAFT_132532 [Helicostylum pulchrum]|nr:hypothetical protein EDC94DRAFT_132532 [Helicostylum pulchrum]